MEEIADIENRRRIYRLIAKNPGLNLSDISKIIHLSVQLIDYHTSFLEKYGLITSDKQEGYKRYYPTGSIGAKEKKYLSILRQEIPLKIVLFLLEKPNSKHKEILSNFDILPSALTYHLNKLIKKDIVEFKKEPGSHGVYSLKNEKEIILFIIKYKPYKILKRFKDTWEGFHIP